ncbi:MAG: FAD-dependent oxidoreductase [Candidatus Aenigmarchaeota archaeon]|nr:FAD-dependent oxidoreductase [Candidatus Aenigmarchaeota archaeon]
MYDTIIIGAGIAGMTAAIYAARKVMKFEILSTDTGGQFLVSGEVLNYPGIVRTTGFDFRKTMLEQLEYNKVKVKNETVRDVRKKGDTFTVITDKSSYDTKTVIVAVGSKARKLGVPGEEKFANKGVAYCSVCDGPVFSGMDVAIVGGGNSALEAADFMKDIASKIYLIVRGGEFRGHEYLIERVKKNPKVEIIFNADTKEIKGDAMVSSLKYEKDGKEVELKVRGVIIEIGRVPNTELFRNVVEMDQTGHIKIDCHGRTTTPGIFAAGDCVSGSEYQYVISAGQGTMALLKVAKYLAEKD